MAGRSALVEMSYELKAAAELAEFVLDQQGGLCGVKRPRQQTTLEEQLSPAPAKRQKQERATAPAQTPKE
jgi:hypothetical protein